MMVKRNCFYCDKCEYLGEGDYVCDEEQEIVVSSFEPTEAFLVCKGRKFVGEELSRGDRDNKRSK